MPSLGHQWVRMKASIRPSSWCPLGLKGAALGLMGKFWLASGLHHSWIETLVPIHFFFLCVETPGNGSGPQLYS